MTCCKLTAYEKGIGRHENAERRGPNHAYRLYQPAAILTRRGLRPLLLFFVFEEGSLLFFSSVSICSPVRFKGVQKWTAPQSTQYPGGKDAARSFFQAHWQRNKTEKETGRTAPQV